MLKDISIDSNLAQLICGAINEDCAIHCGRGPDQFCLKVETLTRDIQKAGYSNILPCALGDDIYQLVLFRDGKPSHINKTKCVGLHHSIGYPNKTRTGKEHRYLVVKSEYGSAVHIDMKRIGDDVFFDEEKAKIRMEEIQEQWLKNHPDKECMNCVERRNDFM